VEEADSNAWSPFEKALPFMIQEVGFAPDSPLEEAGFKLSVPRPNAELSDTLLERRQVRAKGQAEFGPAFSLFHPE
jgi:hypothetical protein